MLGQEALRDEEMLGMHDHRHAEHDGTEDDEDGAAEVRTAPTACLHRDADARRRLICAQLVHPARHALSPKQISLRDSCLSKFSRHLQGSTASLCQLEPDTHHKQPWCAQEEGDEDEDMDAGIWEEDDEGDMLPLVRGDGGSRLQSFDAQRGPGRWIWRGAGQHPGDMDPFDPGSQVGGCEVQGAAGAAWQAEQCGAWGAVFMGGPSPALVVLLQAQAVHLPAPRSDRALTRRASGISWTC